VLLLQLAEGFAKARNYEKAYGLLSGAVVLLEELKKECATCRAERLLAAYIQMTRAADHWGREQEAEAALQHGEALAAKISFESVEDADTAAAVAQTHDLRARLHLREKEFGQAIMDRNKAAVWLERAVACQPEDVRLRMTLVSTYRRIADHCQRQSYFVQEETACRQAITVINEGLSRIPRHRELLLRRASVHATLGECCLAAGNENRAQDAFERAAEDFATVTLRKQDSRKLWMEATRTLQALGRLYAERGRRADAAVAYEQSLAHLSDLKTRVRDDAHYERYSKVARHALTQLGQ
jgi:tetratricopeptide (TPR) repeat protein